MGAYEVLALELPRDTWVPVDGRTDGPTRTDGQGPTRTDGRAGSYGSFRSMQFLSRRLPAATHPRQAVSRLWMYLAGPLNPPSFPHGYIGRQEGLWGGAFRVLGLQSLGLHWIPYTDGRRGGRTRRAYSGGSACRVEDSCCAARGGDMYQAGHPHLRVLGSALPCPGFGALRALRVFEVYLGNRRGGVLGLERPQGYMGSRGRVNSDGRLDGRMDEGGADPDG